MVTGLRGHCRANPGPKPIPLFQDDRSTPVAFFVGAHRDVPLIGQTFRLAISSARKTSGKSVSLHERLGWWSPSPSKRQFTIVEHLLGMCNYRSADSLHYSQCITSHSPPLSLSPVFLCFLFAGSFLVDLAISILQIFVPIGQLLRPSWGEGVEEYGATSAARYPPSLAFLLHQPSLAHSIQPHPCGILGYLQLGGYIADSNGSGPSYEP